MNDVPFFTPRPGMLGSFNVFLGTRYLGVIYQDGDGWRTDRDHQPAAIFPTATLAMQHCVVQAGKGI